MMLIFKQKNGGNCCINTKRVTVLYSLEHGTRICLAENDFVDVDESIIKVRDQINNEELDLGNLIHDILPCIGNMSD